MKYMTVIIKSETFVLTNEVTNATIHIALKECVHVNEKVFVFVIRINEIGSVTNLDIVKKLHFK